MHVCVCVMCECVRTCVHVYLWEELLGEVGLKHIRRLVESYSRDVEPISPYVIWLWGNQCSDTVFVETISWRAHLQKWREKYCRDSMQTSLWMFGISNSVKGVMLKTAFQGKKGIWSYKWGVYFSVCILPSILLYETKNNAKKTRTQEDWWLAEKAVAGIVSYSTML